MNVPYTAGPWHRNIKPATKYPVIFAGRNTHVLTVSTSGLSPEEVEANLCLVLHAPTLHKAARSLLDAFGSDVPEWLVAEYDALGAACDAVEGR